VRDNVEIDLDCVSTLFRRTEIMSRFFVLLIGMVTSILLGARAQAVPSCANLLPDPDPSRNFGTIMACLSGPEASAHLGPGAFPISRKIKIPENASLVGAGPDATKIAAGEGFHDNSLLEASGGDTVESLSLAGQGRLTSTCCTTVVSITGSGSKLRRLEVTDGDARSRADNDPKDHVAGVYFIGDPGSHDNFATELKIHGMHYGVIFRKGLRGDADNRLTNSEIFDLSCDSVTFAGGGSVSGNRIHDAGYNCKQSPPIPGGGFYAGNNSAGIVMADNKISEVCGSGFDIVGSAHVRIVGNKTIQHGLPFGGRYPYCHGTSAAFVDDSDMTIENNVFDMKDTLPLGVSFHLHPAYAHQMAGQYAPLPDKERQIVGVRLLQTKKSSSGNRFANNRIVTECSPGGPCAGHGVALFIGPGAGAGSPNTFVNNTIIATGTPAIFCGAGVHEGNKLCVGNAGGCTPAKSAEDSCGGR
jgi:hypothetical protein